MTTIDNDFSAKFCPKYICEKCDYFTSKKSSFKTHTESKKHLTTICNENYAKNCSKQYSCNKCEKIYKDRAGLWRHSKKCNKTKMTSSESLFCFYSSTKFTSTHSCLYKFV